MDLVSLNIGLVGLIDPLIQLTNIVKAYRSFTPDSDALNAQFEAERLRFERWKRDVGSDTQLPADQQTRSVMENLLNNPPWINAILGTVDNHHTREEGAGSKRHKLTWALGRKRDLTDLTLTELRQGLAKAQADTRREIHSWLLGQHFSNERYYDSALDSPPDTPEILWIHGPPGFGKTILSSRIVEHILAIPNRSVVYFFFSSDYKSRNDPYIDQATPRSAVVQLLYEALQVIPGRYLVIDGLDEYTLLTDSSNSIARFLEDTDDPNRLAEYQMSPKDVQANATTFARSIVDRKLPKKSPNTAGPKNLRQLRRALEGTPTELDHVYKPNWDRIGRNNRVVALPCWAAFALRPLAISEIREAVLIDEDCEALPTNELPDTIDDEYIDTEILEPCGPLIEIRDSHPESAANRTNEKLRASNEQTQHTILARFYDPNINKSSFGAIETTPQRRCITHVKLGVPLQRDSDTLERILGFINESNPYWDEAEDEEIPPGPPYYAFKLGLTAVAVGHIRKFGPEKKTNCVRSYSPVHSAIRQGHLEVVKFLIEQGADIKAVTKDGRTPVHYATANGHLEVVKSLAEQGADFKAVTNNGWIPIDYAASK
ncbi:hypothetical protein C7999DRAFT_42801 [Corynascus novoguineensis]|uniref:Nephrocystin 3-like N-terminal domain-containing protein n=1 Tax=Corynascus novoguineensis TaxID=1126955 RepID=A0AAN7CR60_9PEZI|nr:hypothetical protein C7999DRAFT_42801 [Corynascus novoguineensis]